MLTSRADAAALDDADPLAPCRERFTIPNGLIYLDGNSLGALPAGAAARVAAAVTQEWGQDLIGSWDARWWDEPVRLGERIAPLIGAAPGQVVASDSTSVNIYKLVTAACRLRPERHTIVLDPDDFPTDRYIVGAIAGANVATTIDHQTAVVVLSHVNYRSGRMLDLAAVTAEAHAAGALVMWDLCHSVGAVPVELDAAGADFAVGCTYKYLNGGPGSPSFCYVAHRHQPVLHQPIPGWHGHARPFAMEASYEPDPGIRRVLVGTPPILSLAALDAALDAFDGVTMTELRAKSVALCELFIELADERLARHRVRVVSPRDATQRGSQVCLAHPAARALVPALTDRDVLADFRTPDVLRFGFAPLYIRYVDVWDAVDRLVVVLNESGGS